jgi:hypothetical protein
MPQGALAAQPITKVKSKSTKETNSLFVSREQPIGGMTAPLISASPGEPDAGRQTESPHSECRPSRITPRSSQKSLTTLIDTDAEWDCFIIVVLAVL